MGALNSKCSWVSKHTAVFDIIDIIRVTIIFQQFLQTSNNHSITIQIVPHKRGDNKSEIFSITTYYRGTRIVYYTSFTLVLDQSFEFSDENSLVRNSNFYNSYLMYVAILATISRSTAIYFVLENKLF